MSNYGNLEYNDCILIEIIDEGKYFNPLKLISDKKDNKNKKYILEQYDDGTFGYKGIDNLNNERNIVSQQNQNESREDYISRCGITFKNNQYGSNEKFDRMVNSPSDCDKFQVIDKNYGIDKLVKDESTIVRKRIAKNGYYIDILKFDKNYLVRLELAKNGLALDILVYDKNEYVRQEVAERGYGLDLLINNSPNMNKIIKKWLEEHNLTLNQYNKDKLYWYNQAMKK